MAGCHIRKARVGGAPGQPWLKVGDAPTPAQTAFVWGPHRGWRQRECVWTVFAETCSGRRL